MLLKYMIRITCTHKQITPWGGQKNFLNSGVDDIMGTSIMSKIQKIDHVTGAMIKIVNKTKWKKVTYNHSHFRERRVGSPMKQVWEIKG